MQGTITVFEPTGRKKGQQSIGARRLPTLEGKRVAVIWNGKLGGDVFLNRVAQRLREGFRAEVERIDERADTATVMGEALIGRLAKDFDAAIIGSGD